MFGLSRLIGRRPLAQECVVGGGGGGGNRGGEENGGGGGGGEGGGGDGGVKSKSKCWRRKEDAEVTQPGTLTFKSTR